MPNMAIDPLVAMSHIHLGIHEINSREITPGKFLVATIGKMNGGTTFNIIPDTASMSGTIRTFDKDVRTLARTRIREIAEGIGAAYRCGVEVNYSIECPSLINNDFLLEKTFQYTKEILGEDQVLEGKTIELGTLSGSEDFAFISERVPSVVIGIGGSVQIDGVIYNQHHPKVVFDESVLVNGTAIYVNCALKWLQDNQ